MEDLSPIKSLGIAALIIVPMTVMGCSNSLTGVDANSGQDVIHQSSPTMSNSGDSGENLPPGDDI